MSYEYMYVNERTLDDVDATGLGPAAVACFLVAGCCCMVGRDAVISAACRLAAAAPPKKAGASMLSKSSSAEGSSDFFFAGGCFGWVLDRSVGRSTGMHASMTRTHVCCTQT